jgi:hypothetical protein
MAAIFFVGVLLRPREFYVAGKNRGQVIAVYKAVIGLLLGTLYVLGMLPSSFWGLLELAVILMFPLFLFHYSQSFFP